MAKVELHLKRPDVIAKRILYNDRIQTFFASTCAREMKPYIPARNNILKNAYTLEPTSQNGHKSYMIVYDARPQTGGGTSYAYYQWKGVSKSGKKLNYNKMMSPKAQSKWNEGFSKEKGKTVARELQAFIDRL